MGLGDIVVSLVRLAGNWPLWLGLLADARHDEQRRGAESTTAGC